MTPLPPPGYELLERLGAGGAGEVWRARGRDLLGRAFAVKVLPDGEAWERELETLRRVEELREAAGSQDLVQTFLARRVEDRGYLVMEFMSGGDLWQRVKAEGRLGARESVELLLPVARALELLHAEGLIHKDVKPNNVLLDGEGRARLADFGLARFQDAPLSRSGTPGFCAPEVYAGGALPTQPQLDVYGLGATLHCLLTGQAPPLGHPDLLRLEALEVDRGLQTLLLAWLDPDPAKRPADGAAARVDLEAWLSGGSPSERPTPAGSRAWALGGAVFGCLALGGLSLLLARDPAPATPPPASEEGSPSEPGSGEPAALPSAGSSPEAPATGRGDRGTPRWDGLELRARGPALVWREGDAFSSEGAQLFRFGRSPRSVARDASGALVAAGDAVGYVRVGRIGAGGAPLFEAAEAGSLLLLRVALDPQRVARLSVYEEGLDWVEVWDLASAQRSSRVAVPPSGALALLPEEGGELRFVLGGLDGHLRVCDEEGVRATLVSHGDEIRALTPGHGVLHVLGAEPKGEGRELWVRTYRSAALAEGRKVLVSEATLSEWRPGS